jgi:hypothetical protein
MQERMVCTKRHTEPIISLSNNYCSLVSDAEIVLFGETN